MGNSEFRQHTSGLKARSIYTLWIRSKFRPRVVDGIATITTDVVRRYRFELDK